MYFYNTFSLIYISINLNNITRIALLNKFWNSEKVVKENWRNLDARTMNLILMDSNVDVLIYWVNK